MNETELLDLKKTIEDAIEKQNKLEAKKEVLMEELKNNYGVASLTEATDKLLAMEKEIDREAAELEQAITDLETKLNEGETEDTA